MWDYMEHSWAAVARIHQQVAKLMGGLLQHPGGFQFNGYFSPQGTQAFGLHNDDGDVFILQISGGKHWRVQTSPSKPNSMEFSGGAEKEVDAEYLEAMLEPGDMLYIPIFHKHEARAVGSHSASVSMTVAASHETLQKAGTKVDGDGGADSFNSFRQKIWTRSVSAIRDCIREQRGDTLPPPSSLDSLWRLQSPWDEYAKNADVNNTVLGGRLAQVMLASDRGKLVSRRIIDLLVGAIRTFGPEDPAQHPHSHPSANRESVPRPPFVSKTRDLMKTNDDLMKVSQAVTLHSLGVAQL